MSSHIQNLEVAKPFLRDANHYDEKVIEGEQSLREFLAGFLSYYPGWIKALYGIRAGFVRLLGMKQDGMPGGAPRLKPSDINFEAGKPGTIFVVDAGQEEAYWIASATDKHLTAHLIVAVEPLADGRKRFHIGTVVHYHNWAGPVYFNVIRPFHHIVVSQMMKAGIRPV